jgi:hypothetical protein
MKFEVLTAMQMIVVFWVMMPLSTVGGYQHFFRVEAIGSSKMFVIS